MHHLSKQLVWFGVGGFVGFVVDAGIVQLLVSVLHADPYVGRLFSFLCAGIVGYRRAVARNPTARVRIGVPVVRPTGRRAAKAGSGGS